jgi:hypothetical protein
MASERIHIGDRVRLIAWIGGLSVGTLGTVQQSFYFNDTYYVVFEGSTLPRLIAGDSLERVSDEALEASS